MNNIDKFMQIKPFTYQMKDTTITIHHIGKCIMNGIELLELHVSALKQNREIILNNPFLYQNPPVCIVVNGKKVENYTEALKQMVYDTIMLTGK